LANGLTHLTKRKPVNSVLNVACAAELLNSKSTNLDVFPTSLDLQKTLWHSIPAEKAILSQIPARKTFHLVIGQNFLALPQNIITRNQLQIVARSLLFLCPFLTHALVPASILPMTQPWHIPDKTLVISFIHAWACTNPRRQLVAGIL
jgi:hypothetical protein